MKWNRFKIAIICALCLCSVSANAQVLPEPSGWIRSGNCWFAEQGFLYCGERHPYHEIGSETFVSFVCFKHYQAVLLGHPESPLESEVRTIESDFGVREYIDIWIAADAKESFMSSNVDATNAGYVNLLKGLANPDSKKLAFTLEPGNVEGLIELTGQEYHVVNAYIDVCSQIAN